MQPAGVQQIMKIDPLDLMIVNGLNGCVTVILSTYEQTQNKSTSSQIEYITGTSYLALEQQISS